MTRLLLVLLLPLLGLACAEQPIGKRVAVSPRQAELVVPGDAPADLPLTFGTYNLHGGDAVERLRADLAAYPASVWAFQELKVPESGDADALLRRLLPPGRWWVVVKAMNRDGDLREAQAIASRWPIHDVTLWELIASGDKQRAALVARLDTPAGDVWFVNTDHQVSYFSLSDYNGRQAKLLALKVNVRLRSERVVAAGDFNTTGNLWRLQSNAADVRRLDEAMRLADLQPLPGRTPAVTTFRSFGGERQLDHIYFRGLTWVEWVCPWWGGSDHRPLVARFASP